MKHKVYSITVAVLAIASIIIAVLDLTSLVDVSAAPYKQIDTAILLIFTVDYAVRFYRSEERKRFFKENIFDLIAIIPFNSIFSAFRTFRLFRLAKLTKLSKMSRIVRASAFVGIIKGKLSGILRTNGLIYLIYLNTALILVSSFIMIYAEGMTFADALWWSIVTCTTVGYGDISPESAVGRTVAFVLMMLGISLIGMLTSSITTYFTQPKQKEAAESDELADIISSMDEDQKQKLLEIAKIIMK